MNTALKFKLIIGSLCILIVMLCTTQPNRLPSFVLVVPFVFIFCALWLAIAAVLSWFYDRSATKNLRAAALAAVLPMLLLILQSIGQLTVRDVLIIIALFGLAYFYMARMGAGTNH